MLQVAQDGMFGFLERSDVFPALIVLSSLLAGLVIAVVAIIAGVLKARAREGTKREIAAYVAEGTIDKETAVALLQAEGDADMKGICCVIGAGRKDHAEPPVAVAVAP